MNQIIKKILHNQRGAMMKLILTVSILIIGLFGLIILDSSNDKSNDESIAEIESFMNKNAPAAGEEYEIETIKSNRKKLNID